LRTCTPICFTNANAGPFRKSARSHPWCYFSCSGTVCSTIGSKQNQNYHSFCPPMNDHNGILLALCRCAILQPIYFSLIRNLSVALKFQILILESGIEPGLITTTSQQQCPSYTTPTYLFTFVFYGEIVGVTPSLLLAHQQSVKLYFCFGFLLIFFFFFQIISLTRGFSE
uniref:Uncharacterized protein n=1 Tax=Cairina moschata TaxID=8855 RepID=A0A8C3C823_CAIMO